MLSECVPLNLTNHFLIAMPGLEDGIFSRSVVFVCEHSASGALGIVVNKPSDMTLTHLFEKVGLPLLRDDLVDESVLHGGPLQTDRGFVLHNLIYDDPNDGKNVIYGSSLSTAGGLALTTSKDILELLSNGGGPGKVLVALGCSAWGAGQLEAELGDNSWLTVDADLSVLFDSPASRKYEDALGLLGLQSWMISSQVGHA